MTDQQFLIFLCIPVILFLIYFIAGKVDTQVSVDETFEAYKRRHPDLVADGKVKCIKCGGTSIWMKPVAAAYGSAKYAHTCRNCGSELYYSNG